MRTLILTAALAAALIGAVSAAPAAKAAKAVKAVKAAVLVCPVTGEKIASIKAAVGHSTYRGKTYYFCCSSCKPMFDKDPAKYVRPAAPKP